MPGQPDNDHLVEVTSSPIMGTNARERPGPAVGPTAMFQQSFQRFPMSLERASALSMDWRTAAAGRHAACIPGWNSPEPDHR